MDENQIGPNINTTTVRRFVGDGPYPSGAVPLQVKGHGFNPQCGQSAGPEAGLETQEQRNLMFFSFFFVL